tara:strand:+ start:11136 stop:12518 length:1383 start_codon:yes stop_codon:yes gene_type:complete
VEDGVISRRIEEKTTWKTELYFLASLVKSPRYIMSVERPHLLFANQDLLSLWRMFEQSVHRRGSEDPLMDPISYDEVTLTGEFGRAINVDIKSLWKSIADPTIKGAPEKFHTLLHNYATLRLIDGTVCDRLSAVSSGDITPQEAVTNLQQDIVGFHPGGSQTPVSVLKVLQDVWLSRDNLTERSRIRTGFPRLDNLIGALVPGCTYLFCARTSHGKSSWAAQIVNQQARDGHRVGVIALEDSKSVWASRWMSRLSGVSLKRIRDNILTRPVEGDKDNKPLNGQEECALAASVTTRYLDNIHLSDAKGASLTDVLRIMNDMVVRHGCECIWLDYIQAIYARPGDSRSRRDFLEYCWAMIEREAERLEVPLMLTAQLNREWERDPLPSMPGLRHTEWLGAAEQKAFVGVVLYRPYRDPRLPQGEQDHRFNELTCNVEKSKQGETVAIPYHFDPSACCITENQ